MGCILRGSVGCEWGLRVRHVGCRCASPNGCHGSGMSNSVIGLVRNLVRWLCWRSIGLNGRRGVSPNIGR